MSDIIPKGWKRVKLGDVVIINPNETLKKGIIAKKVPMEALLPFTKKIQFFIFEKYNSGVKFKNGDTLVARITPSLENGKTVYVDLLDGDEIGFGSTEFIVLREKSGITDKQFIYYFAISKDFRDIAIKSMTGSSGRQRVQNEVVKEFEFPLPPLPEQKAIAGVLSSLDDKIELLHRQNKTLEEMAMTLFRKWFIEDAKEDWGDGVFGDIVQPKKGKNITKKEVIEGPYPVVAGGIEPSCYHNLANTSEPVITISASGANAGYVRLYHTKVWASDSSYIDYSVTPYVYFSYIFLKTNQRALFDKQIGSVQPHVYPMQIMELNCMHYPEKLISKFEKWCTPMFTKIKSNQLQIRILEQMRDILLPKLMSGEVRVYDCEFTEKEEDYERN